MKSQILVVISLGILTSGVHCSSLFSENIDSDEVPPCCQDEKILSCVKISLNATALGDEEIELDTLQETLQFKGMVGDSKTSYHYSNDEADMVITYHENTGGAYGHLSLDNGESFVVEFCGSHGHVLKEIDVENLGEDKGVDAVEAGSERKQIVDNRQIDTTTIVTYSVKVYYTPQFEAATADISGFVDQVVEETNQGYINSGVPIRVKLCGTERATINDQSSFSSMLSAFRNMKGTTAALRGTADAAALLTLSSGYCGIAYMNTISIGNTVSVTSKNCALGYYSFGHELGHNMGLHHNPEVATNTYYSYGHGHLIAQGSASTGYRTILAYSASGHSTRVNYYSNPAVNYPTTGTPTGVTGVSNNARVLTENRFRMAAVGDESNCSITCGSGTCGVESCTMENTYRNFYYRYQGRMDQNACRARCTTTNGCIGWVHHNRGRWCYLYLSRSRSFRGMSVGPDYSSSACSYDTASCVDPRTILRARYRGRSSISSSSACEESCRTNPSCQFWRWYRNRCYMWSADYRSSSSWTSGPKYC